MQRRMLWVVDKLVDLGHVRAKGGVNEMNTGYRKRLGQQVGIEDVGAHRSLKKTSAHMAWLR
jgi:hypothetical protein